MSGPEKSTDEREKARRTADALGLRGFNLAQVVIPEAAGLDWARVAADPRIPLVITNRPAKAVQLCESGQPAIAIMGASEAKVKRWLRKRGAKVIGREGMH